MIEQISGPWAAFFAIVILGLIYWGSISLIDAYFKRKEQFVDTLHDKVTSEKLKGNSDAKSE